MRSSAPVIPAIPDIQPDTVQLGNFFALKSESEDGLLVVQCTQILGKQFNGIVLKKVSDETIHVLYKLEDKVETFLKSSVLTPIVSIVSTGSKSFSIERSEVEDLMYFANN